MKILKPLAIIWVILEIIVSYYYFHVKLGSILELFIPPKLLGNTFILLQVRVWGSALTHLIFILAAIVYFVAPHPFLRNKAYSICRYLYIIQYIFSLPAFLSSLDLYRFSFDSFHGFVSLLGIPVKLAIFIIFLTGKPVNQPRGINLQNYALFITTSRWKRFFIHIVDLLIFLIVSDQLYTILTSEYSFSISTVLVLLSSALLYFVFFFLSEALFNQTMGKILTGSCVAGTDSKMGVEKVVFRTLYRLIPFEGYSFLFKKDWHDKLSGTTVVYINSLEQDSFPEELQTP